MENCFYCINLEDVFFVSVNLFILFDLKIVGICKIVINVDDKVLSGYYYVVVFIFDFDVDVDSDGRFV